MGNFFDTSERERGPLFFFYALKYLLFVLLGATLVASLFWLGLYLYLSYAYRDGLAQRYPQLPENSAVFARNGEEVATLRAAEDRVTVGPEGLGEYLPLAVVAIEDHRFYEHPGVDPAGIARAAWTDLRAWEILEGGSTLTEQLVKNTFFPPEERDSVSFWRRLVQATLAVAYERHHTKEEILTAYLNTAYFGRGVYGAERAAERYFGKSAADLTLPEAATLAGVLHSPASYDSPDELEAATARRNEVLERMQEQGMISMQRLLQAESAPLRYAPEERRENPAASYEPYLDRVRREVEQRLGPEALERGGLRIYTTLDTAMQQAAVQETARLESLPDAPSAALVTVEPETGAIRAVAGKSSGFNLALDARRQPGSAFKPFVLAAALQQGISPETLYVSRELRLERESGTYYVENYGGVERGIITVEEAMAESDNTVFVQLALDVGLRRVAEMAEALGVTSPVDPYPSAAIGGLREGVSPLDMASAYATFASGGVYHEPYSVERVERESFGEVSGLYTHRISGERVLSENEAAAATGVLRGVVERGTASRYHDLDYELGRPSAGKTGTSEEYADAWYVGYTPQLSTAVWVGYPEGRRSMEDLPGLGTVGGETVPLDIWAAYMARATFGQPPEPFPAPDMSGFERLTTGHAVDDPPGIPARFAPDPLELRQWIDNLIENLPVEPPAPSG